MKKTDTDPLRPANIVKLLSQAVNQSSEGIAMTDLDGNLKYVNKAFAEIHGYGVVELVDKNLSILHSPEQMSAVNYAIRQLKERGYFKGEIWHTRCDGSVFPTLMYNSLVLDSMGTPIGMMATLRDITQRKRSEKKLAFQAELLDAIQEAVVATDADGHVTYWNTYAEKVFGWSAEEAVGRTTIELVSTMESRSYGEEILAHLQKGKNWTGEYPARYRDGRQFPIETTITPVFDEAGNVSHTIGISFDITQRKKTEQALKKLRDNLEDLVKERTAELRIALQTVKESEKVLIQRKLKLAEVNKELLETNHAVSVLAKNIDRKKEELEKKVSIICKGKLLPILRTLEKDACCQKRQADLEVIINYLNEFTNESSLDHVINSHLTDQEMRVAMMIKKGLTSQQITDLLCVSLHTIKTHRKNIRKKLKIDNTNINLVSYLKSKLKSDPVQD
jgi:PAS domain S-box-containing protein